MGAGGAAAAAAAAALLVDVDGERTASDVFFFREIDAGWLPVSSYKQSLIQLTLCFLSKIML